MAWNAQEQNVYGLKTTSTSTCIPNTWKHISYKCTVLSLSVFAFLIIHPMQHNTGELTSIELCNLVRNHSELHTLYCWRKGKGSSRSCNDPWLTVQYIRFTHIRSKTHATGASEYIILSATKWQQSIQLEQLYWCQVSIKQSLSH